MSTIEILSRTRVFGGEQTRFQHRSESCAAPMTCTVFMPPAEDPVPSVYWLSGLTCNDENFMIKAGAQRAAAQLGLALVAPDTSPRELGLPGEDDDWDFGSGAGFYVNATRAPWSAHYRMFDYVTAELPAVIAANFRVDERKAISGHSMGGHGALVIGLRQTGTYASISAFAPIAHPSEVPWGRKAFAGYLGDDRDDWLAYDAVHQMRVAEHCPPVLVDQGEADEFIDTQLRPDLLEEAVRQYNRPVEIRRQPGYDHSYYFIATFIEDHLRFHSDVLANY